MLYIANCFENEEELDEIVWKHAYWVRNKHNDDPNSAHLLFQGKLLSWLRKDSLLYSEEIYKIAPKYEKEKSISKETKATRKSLF